MTVQEPCSSVLFKGLLTIRAATALRDRLLQACGTVPMVEIDCSAADEVDVSFLQLLLAAQRSRQQDGRGFRVKYPPDGAMAQAMARAGLPDGTFQAGDPR